MSIATVPLGELMPPKKQTLDPRKSPDKEFELFSIPAFDEGAPEVVSGKHVGSSKQILESGDVLLSKIVPHIRRAWVVEPGSDRPTIGSSEWIIFRSDRFDPAYLRHVLVSDRFHHAFMKTVAGVGGSLLRARPSYVAEIKVLLPSIKEQRRIAAVLDAADALRTKRREALAKLDSLTQAVFADMFMGPQSASRWPIVTLGEVCKAKGEYGANVPSREFDSSRPRYLRITDIRDDGSLIEEAVAPGGQENDWKSKFLRPGDIVFARSGATVGKTFLAREDSDPLVFAGYLIRFVPDQQRIMPEYLYQFTRTGKYHAWVEKAATTVAQPNINAKRYGQLEMPLPPLDEQRRFSSAVQEIRRSSQTLKVQADLLDTLFSSLQQRAFRGEL